jgi:hypothetical protein
MTATTTIPNSLPVEEAPLSAVTFDVYRNIHKGIRLGLFQTTLNFGSVDPGDRDAVERASDGLHDLVRMLIGHAEHEDTHVQPAIERYLPEVAVRIVDDHEAIEAQMARLELLADFATGAAPQQRRLAVHRAYLGLTTFVADYLDHIAFEETVIMPGLSQAMSVDALFEIHTAIVSSIPPNEMAAGLTLMIPSMNVDDRVEAFSGMKDAPPEVLQGVLGLAASVLTPEEFAKTNARLGIA